MRFLCVKGKGATSRSFSITSFSHIAIEECHDLTARAKIIRRECRCAGSLGHFFAHRPKSGIIIVSCFTHIGKRIASAHRRRICIAIEECHGLPACTGIVGRKRRFTDLNKKWRHICQSRVRLHSSFQSDNLLVEHYELFLHHHVFVVVPEEPVLESAVFPNLIEEVRQGIPPE